MSVSFGSVPMSLELRGLIDTLRRGSTPRLSFTPEQIRAALALPPGANRASPCCLEDSCLTRERSGHKKKVAIILLCFLMLFGAFRRYDPDFLRLRSPAQSPGLPARPVSISIPSGGARESRDSSVSSAGDGALDDEIYSSSRRSRRRVLEGINSVTSGSSDSRPSSPPRASGEGTSQVNPGVFPSSTAEGFSWSFAYDREIPIHENPESLATIWRKVRAKGCELPSLEHMRERDAYVRMAVANAKAMEASNDFAALMEGRLTSFHSGEQREVDFEELRRKMGAAEEYNVVAQNDLNSMEEKYNREIEGRDRKARRDLHLARVSLVQEYEGVLAAIGDKFEQKNKETAAEILFARDVSPYRSFDRVQ
ncbi:hypothetical protein F2Q70_00016819 [Brassica cretica]|uniref:Transmembrane protein n=1 Tax=Brassica cretica TaxID=69181 RepID=A0A8S9HTQ2_BRACR|nr:hypothetical protein F2Q70_00016819 [Brassica cretica]